MKIAREIKQWVLDAAGFHNHHMHPGFVEQVRRAVSAEFPDAEVEISYVPFHHPGSRGPGKPWTATGDIPSSLYAPNVTAKASDIERLLLEHAVRTRFDHFRPHPEDRTARVCRRCGQGVAVDHRMPASRAMHKIATNPTLHIKAITHQIDPNNLRETVCSRCRIPM